MSVLDAEVTAIVIEEFPPGCAVLPRELYRDFNDRPSGCKLLDGGPRLTSAFCSPGAVRDLRELLGYVESLEPSEFHPSRQRKVREELELAAAAIRDWVEGLLEGASEKLSDREYRDLLESLEYSDDAEAVTLLMNACMEDNSEDVTTEVTGLQPPDALVETVSESVLIATEQSTEPHDLAGAAAAPVHWDPQQKEAELPKPPKPFRGKRSRKKK